MSKPKREVETKPAKMSLGDTTISKAKAAMNRTLCIERDESIRETIKQTGSHREQKCQIGACSRESRLEGCSILTRHGRIINRRKIHINMDT